MATIDKVNTEILLVISRDLHHLPLSNGTSGWQNYRPCVWQWEEICLIFANRHILVLELLQYYIITSKC